MNIQKLRSFVSRHGLAHTAFYLGYKTVNRAVTAKVLKVIVLPRDSINRSLLTGSDEHWSFLSREELERFAKADPTLNLSDEFLSHAFAHGCQCYGFVQDGTLGSYLWCTNRPYPSPPSMSPRLTVQFDPDYVYAFNGFTAPAFRGLRLHSIGMAQGLQSFVEQGIKGGIGYVEVYNRDSLKSCVGHGYRTIGTAAYFAVGYKGVAYASPGCKPYGFRVAVDEISWQAANNPSINQPLFS
jgi:hypothetical protein